MNSSIASLSKKQFLIEIFKIKFGKSRF